MTTLGKGVVLGLFIISVPLFAVAYGGHNQHSNGQHSGYGHHQGSGGSGSSGSGSGGGSGSGSGGSGGGQPPTPTPPPVTPPPTGSEIILTNVYTTGYANADNTPAGSDETDLGGHTGITGGNGTYTDPTTVAVGGSIINGVEIDDFPYGTIFYVPAFQKYFIATDFCGDGNSPQTQPCHDLAQAPKGATLWLDLWVGGKGK